MSTPPLSREMTLGSGNSALIRWDLPLKEDFPAGPHPLAILVPSLGMKDLEGNSSDLQVRNSLRDHSRNLQQCGFASFRFAPLQRGRDLELKDKLELYRRALDHPSINRWNTVLIGFLDSADLIAKHYYDFFPIHPPGAAVLLSPTVQTIHLNNFTCPYLLIHGERDPLFQSDSHERFEAAVHRHQMRYGDETDARMIRGVGNELGHDEISSAVLEEIRDWLGPLRLARAKRKQERAA